MDGPFPTGFRGATKRILLVDPDPRSRAVLVRRLAAQGYQVDATGDAAEGADAALGSPPAAVVADLWMPGISGVQLCRMLRAEAATAEVPIVLRGEHDDPRSRFWSERAGATSYVAKGLMGELVRAIATAVAQSGGDDAFFMQLSGGSVDIRDRIARHLDDALFESVIASEVRALAKHDTFERFFDNFSQFLSRVVRYRWVAVRTAHGAAVHHHPADTAPVEARHALAMPSDAPLLSVVDEDPCHEPVGAGPIVRTIALDDRACGIIAFAPSAEEPDSTALVDLVARELGLPLRISALMEESRRMATTDPLTRLMNRRAFSDLLAIELGRSRRYVLPLSLLLIDIDHFKSINDTHGHGAGDSVIRAIGELLRRQCRISDTAARWGGEEFVISLTNTDLGGAQIMAERIRAAVEKLEVSHEGQILRVTASIGATSLAHEVQLDTFVERADRAMYEAKQSGRNRVCALGPISVAPPARAADAQAAS